MNTKRSKRWNGELESLSTEFLKNVVEKMEAYGDRVQFQLPGKAKQPSYQVIGRGDRKMGFDEKHLLLRLNEEGNVAEDLSPVFPLDVIRAAAAGKPPRAAVAPRAPRAASPRATTAGRSAAPVAPAVDTVEHEKYAYYKANRDYLPEGITRYSADISAIMRTGVPAEEAFERVIKTHFSDL